MFAFKLAKVLNPGSKNYFLYFFFQKIVCSKFPKYDRIEKAAMEKATGL